MGYNASVLSVGTAGYPLIGGAMAMLGWYYPFILPLLAIPLGLIVLFILKNPEPKNEQSLKEYLCNAWKKYKEYVGDCGFSSPVLLLLLYYTDRS